MRSRSSGNQLLERLLLQTAIFYKHFCRSKPFSLLFQQADCRFGELGPHAVAFAEADDRAETASLHLFCQVNEAIVELIQSRNVALALVTDQPHVRGEKPDTVFQGIRILWWDLSRIVQGLFRKFWWKNILYYWDVCRETGSIIIFSGWFF